MPRPRKLAPRYLKHSKSGKGRLVWTDAVGVRYERLLPGPFGSPESLAAKARLELELATSPTNTPAAPDRITVAEVILAFHNFAVRHYLDLDGLPTKELLVIRYALRPLRELYGTSRATESGPLKLKTVRQRMIDTKLSRALINRRVSVFKWAASEELIPASVYDGLRTVSRSNSSWADGHGLGPLRPDVALPWLRSRLEYGTRVGPQLPAVRLFANW
ncbi:Integrase family protein OS=Planctomyces limnophilus (strain ATCC 43296 / DSM 3776 / IFAM 1008 / 290) GN=Plim_1106 PE=4 SV=1 [Gemmata massiliana]|uniref:Integrase family protein n=1 Tax=Gemmata massiliana TaxID=1210884 RepID=A0A6P2CSJ0_9BACT|nr:hypothetical protein [Gemmata massiliana]VTR91577.1 Integrase family protein OS=Planctomyces limnophilus (strain ATCC 43296 / DSM 3776 / IFAM 1008 / 290) GN=Plim_1106 PE=4 SV=1 [Gemmata massiliana]